MIRKPPIPLLDNDESNDCFAKKQIPADSRIQLLLNWNTVNIFLFLKGMCLKFKLEPFFFKEKRKLRIPGVLQSLQERCSSCPIIERVVLHIESVCGSDRASVEGMYHLKKRVSVSTRQFQIKYYHQPPSTVSSSHSV